MALQSLLYVSVSRIDFPADEPELTKLVDAARARNQLLGITGALMFTETHFAQVIEGPSAAVAELMYSIRADPRHTDIVVLEVETLARRRFASWRMAYCGPPTLIDTPTRRLLEAASAVSAPSLITLIRELSEIG